MDELDRVFSLPSSLTVMETPDMVPAEPTNEIVENKQQSESAGTSEKRSRKRRSTTTTTSSKQPEAKRSKQAPTQNDTIDASPVPKSRGGGSAKVGVNQKEAIHVVNRGFRYYGCPFCGYWLESSVGRPKKVLPHRDNQCKNYQHIADLYAEKQIPEQLKPVTEYEPDCVTKSNGQIKFIMAASERNPEFLQQVLRVAEKYDLHHDWRVVEVKKSFDRI